MKKISILTITLLLCFAGFAQRITHFHEQPISSFDPSTALATPKAAAKTTAAGDTLILRNTASDTTTLYRLDSGGYVTGTNFWGDKAFAERYDFNNADSSIRVLGVVALFGGTISATTSKTITFDVWDAGRQQPITGSLFYNGFPGTLLNTITVPVNQIGIGAVTDTLKNHWFTAPTYLPSSSFFVGYNINYNYNTLNGDTIGLANSPNGVRLPAGSAGLFSLVYNASTIDTTLDTVLNVQNATLGSDNVWYDNYTQNDSIKNNLAIYPIVLIGFPNGVNGVTKNNLTFFGNYPNPAGDYTNIRFSLAQSADVSLQIMDMAGRMTETIKQTNLSIGEHLISVSTAHLAAGEYLYLLRTSGGDGMAGKMSKK
jgi:hypothetical protein